MCLSGDNVTDYVHKYATYDINEEHKNFRCSAADAH